MNRMEYDYILVGFIVGALLACIATYKYLTDKTIKERVALLKSHDADLKDVSDRMLQLIKKHEDEKYKLSASVKELNAKVIQLRTGITTVSNHIDSMPLYDAGSISIWTSTLKEKVRELD